MESFKSSIVQLITETSTNLPADVRQVVAEALEREQPGTSAAQSLAVIARNIDMAAENVGPICQDTGMPTFEIDCPAGADQLCMERQIREAIAEVTAAGRLRPNSVDSLTGKNSGNNLGPGTPVIHFHQWERDEARVRLLLKGGGCENMNIQYSLPAELPGGGRAGRNREGVRKCILHAVHQAQGYGCSPGLLGVCVGSDRAGGYQHAKEQLFRSLDDVNPVPELRELEEAVMATVNDLSIGTMGFGGQVTLLGCKIGAINRLPASFFVSVAYECWAFRRMGVILDAGTGAIREWLYREAEPAPLAVSPGLPLTGREVRLTTPLSEQEMLNLKVGDVVLLSGEVHTGRDALHAYLMEHNSPVDLRGGVIYHCGPVMLKEGDQWTVKAAGPTTSIREEPYQGEVLRRFGVRMVIGKGGMGEKTLAALKECGAAYLTAIGGAAQYYAGCIKGVTGVHFREEFGVPEAMWHLRVEDFLAVCTMDAHGNSLHAEVERKSLDRLSEMD